ncbi:protein of unknown function DUF52 [Denitrovibrio acetiphilus DSM 12809]|jgi:hypothetical protein|uniref:MEMO1 family protein Dacet_1840 n=1 Tax=Denitrovibrio acetiphilus (strain DSM 12809 / NBRC 114555 / N2460) TaxID=522772 RepID=D4H0U1_DENA2|nr:AmmeMemoRadiSam system protein B [Denitrovibrio acetiphilus]ADD68604.1 protein of unknown function DUF52 [Denitrovibrio acetiphilus DSM 12809]
MHRQAAVAGVFYPADAGSVTEFIKSSLPDGAPEKAVGVVVPHAGYIYSGATAVRTLARVKIPDTVILVGPNHTGAGPSISVYPEGSWATPLGDVPVDSVLVDKFCENPLFNKDTTAHHSEHSLEVILPILKYFNPDVKVVCVTVKYINLETAETAAKHIADVTDALFVISSDLNHFEDAEITERKDMAVMEKLLEMDMNGLYYIVPEENISMCGVVPACMGIRYCQAKGADTAVFVEHIHSGLVSGDNNRVVGYAGLYYK